MESNHLVRNLWKFTWKPAQIPRKLFETKHENQISMCTPCGQQNGRKDDTQPDVEIRVYFAIVFLNTDVQSDIGHKNPNPPYGIIRVIKRNKVSDE